MSGINTSPPPPAPADEYHTMPPPVTPLSHHPFCARDVCDHNTSAYPQAPREIISPPDAAGSSAADIATMLGDMKAMVKTLTDSIHVADSIRAKFRDEILRFEARDHTGSGALLVNPQRRRRGMTLKQAARQNVLRPMHKSKQHKKSTSAKVPIVPCTRHACCTKDWNHCGECAMGDITRLCSSCDKRYGHIGRCVNKEWKGRQEWKAVAPDDFPWKDSE